MTTVESLDALSNAEIRMKCIEYGLPNVPVTDSSRKLLLKRLRESMASKDVSGVEAATKSSGRRETIHASKNNETINNEPLSLSQPTRSRRTIAAVAPAVNKDDTAAVPTSIPISTRRRSMHKEAEQKPVKPSKSDTPTIIIEDDEDNDLVNALENAERESTTSSLPVETITSRRKSRSVSVPKVVETVTTNKKRAMTPLVEELTVTEKSSKNKQKDLPDIAVSNKSKPKDVVPDIADSNKTKPKDVPDIAVSNSNAAAQKSFEPSFSSYTTFSTQAPPKATNPMDIAGNRYGVQGQGNQGTTNYQPLSTQMGIEGGVTNRFSSHSQNMQTTTSTVYSSPALRYSIGGSLGLGALRTKYTVEELLNEQSDTECKTVDGTQSPFLSNFARNLERSRSVGRSTGGGLSGNYKKRYSDSSYASIRGRQSCQDDVPTFGELIQGLNRRYNLKFLFILSLVLSLIIFAFIRFYSV